MSTETGYLRPPGQRECWCNSLEHGGSANRDYVVCQRCGTALLSSVPGSDEELYNEQYWNEHQKQLGLPTIELRARMDLPERCTYWLAHLLRYVRPEGKLLEIGCSHGGFLKLAKMAGFDVLGIEMDQAIVDKAASWFGVPVLQGPLERIGDSVGRFDVVAMMDVLEHLPNPTDTLKAVADRLTEKGIIVIQTPEYHAHRESSWRMFNAPEHINLFTRESASQLLRSVGFNHIAFEPAIFADSDMFIFASRSALHPYSSAEMAASLTQAPDGRVVLGLLDSYRSQQALRITHDPVESYGIRGLLGHLMRAICTWPVRKLREKQATSIA